MAVSVYKARIYILSGSVYDLGTVCRQTLSNLDNLSSVHKDVCLVGFAVHHIVNPPVFNTQHVSFLLKIFLLTRRIQNPAGQ